MGFLNNIIKKVSNMSLKYKLLVVLSIFFICLISLKPVIASNKNSLESYGKENELMVFVQDGCIHCTHAEEFLDSIKDNFKNVNIVYYNLKDNTSQVKLFRNISRLRISQNGLGTPIFIMGDSYIVGFGDKEKDNLIQLLNEKKIK